MIDKLLEDSDVIKCFVLTNSECPHCKEWFDSEYQKLVNQFAEVVFHVVDCYQEQQNGAMWFPPVIAPTFYFYKDKKDFPLINQGLLPEFEMIKSFTKAIEILKND